MKKYLFLAATAFMFAACANEEAAVPQVTQTDTTPGALVFDTYTPAATRAGQTGVMTTKVLQETTGFGVFACQQENGNAYAAYKDGTNIIPNFMYNQKVSYSSGSWTYSPIKYWPNETTKDSQTDVTPATSTHTDRLSFFAYAPYVETPATGVAGINSFIANTGVTDPYVEYTIATKPSESVDLLWGVAPTGGLKYQSVNPDVEITINQYKPFLDLVKPAKDQKIKFLFNHALARIGLKVVAAADQIAPGGVIKATETKIVIKDVTIYSSSVMTTGKLNLNSTQWVPVGATIETATAGQSKWEEATGPLSLTIDKDNELDAQLQAVFSGTPATLDAASSFAKTGVTTSEKDLIEKDTEGNSQYFMVIPKHIDTSFKVDITYYVITNDTKVNGEYVVTENTISKTITIPNFTNNKAYTMKLILGLTSVKLDAEVADWQVDGSTEVNLPRNNE